MSRALVARARSTRPQATTASVKRARSRCSLVAPPPCGAAALRESRQSNGEVGLVGMVITPPDHHTCAPVEAEAEDARKSYP